MEGLEISEITLRTCLSIIDFRIDSNTYKKDYINTDVLIHSKTHSIVEKLSISIQNFGAYSLCNYINFVDSGIPFLMTKNIRHNYIDWNIEKYVDETSHRMLYKSHCKKGQVLVTMAGEYLGRVAVYDTDFVCSSNQAIAKITLKSDINPYLVSTFFNSIHGQNEINRFRTITGQPNINMSLINSLLVPDFSVGFSLQIEELIISSNKYRVQSFEKYNKAENLLLKQIELNKIDIVNGGINIKSFKDSFLVTGRIDAEYYQPKYEQIVKHIKNRIHDTLKHIVTITKSIEPGSDNYSEEGLPFLRVSDYNKYGLSEPDKKLSHSFCKENESLINQLKPKKGTILFSKDGSLGNAYMLREDIDAITSGAVLHLKVRELNRIIPEYLTLVLNSQIVQMQAERDAGGSIILHWRISEIENVVVPIIEYEEQRVIADMVEESFKLREESERHLEVAKRSLEIAIEQDEDAAVRFIREHVSVT